MLAEIGDVMRECYRRGWITTRDGNCSLRDAGSNILNITPTGIDKTKIYPHNITKMEVDHAGPIIRVDDKPSGELEMHWLLLENIEDTRCVLHVHPTNIVAAMYAGWSLQKAAEDFPEVYRYTRVGPNVPAHPAISRELAEATATAMGAWHGKTHYDVVGQANHGACSVGKTPWEAFEHIERLEHICQIVLKSGVRPSIITAMPV